MSEKHLLSAFEPDPTRGTYCSLVHRPRFAGSSQSYHEETDSINAHSLSRGSGYESIGAGAAGCWFSLDNNHRNGIYAVIRWMADGFSSCIHLYGAAPDAVFYDPFGLSSILNLGIESPP